MSEITTGGFDQYGIV